MPVRNRLMLLAAGTFAVAALSLPALARDGAASTTEFSAQAMIGPGADTKGKPRQAPNRAAPIQRSQPMQRAAPRQPRWYARRSNASRHAPLHVLHPWSALPRRPAATCREM